MESGPSGTVGHEAREDGQLRRGGVAHQAGQIGQRRSLAPRAPDGRSVGAKEGGQFRARLLGDPRGGFLRGGQLFADLDLQSQERHAACRRALAHGRDCSERLVDPLDEGRRRLGATRLLTSAGPGIGELFELIDHRPHVSGPDSELIRPDLEIPLETRPEVGQVGQLGLRRCRRELALGLHLGVRDALGHCRQPGFDGEERRRGSDALLQASENGDELVGLERDVRRRNGTRHRLGRHGRAGRLRRGSRGGGDGSGGSGRCGLARRGRWRLAERECPGHRREKDDRT